MRDLRQFQASARIHNHTACAPVISDQRYSYKESTKSDASDELINTWLLRPIAGIIVRCLFPTRVTPNQVTVAAIVVGLFSAIAYSGGSRLEVAAGGLLLTLKDILDSADGQLARAKNLYSRAGRFLDSIGDILVNLAVFACIGIALIRTGSPPMESVLPALLSFLFLTLRVSYHVFYQTSFLHLQQAYALNRVSEEIREEDLGQDRTTRILQRIFQAMYGWQDRLMARIDRWSARGSINDAAAWYGDRTALRISGFLGLGTELFLVMAFSLAGELQTYFLVNLAGMNAVWGGCVIYRRILAAATRGGKHLAG
jgi:phosphatidylglycerophosphate synthase